MGVAIPFRAMPSADAQRRLGRLRSLAWLLDRSIPLGRWRIGLDPIIGLVPVAGDWLGSLLSLYVLYEGGRLGLPIGVLMRMGGNILVETVLGSVPVIGDIFDCAWQSNARNVSLIDRYYRPGLRPRSLAHLWLAVLIFAAVLLGISVTMLYFALKPIAAAWMALRTGHA